MTTCAQNLFNQHAQGLQSAYARHVQIDSTVRQSCLARLMPSTHRHLPPPHFIRCNTSLMPLRNRV
jgi:hypothetical protein